MIFGSRRKKVTAFVEDAVRPAIEMIAERYGFPPAFWTDPYVLGYLNGQISAFAKFFGKGKLSPTDVSNVIVDVVANLSAPQHNEALQAMVKWGAQQDPIFNEADGNGYLVASYTFDVINDPKITGVRERVIKIETNDAARAKASSNGIQQFWSDKIEERFGLTQS